MQEKMQPLKSFKVNCQFRISSGKDAFPEIKKKLETAIMDKHHSTHTNGNIIRGYLNDRLNSTYRHHRGLKGLYIPNNKVPQITFYEEKEGSFLMFLTIVAKEFSTAAQLGTFIAKYIKDVVDDLHRILNDELDYQYETSVSIPGLGECTIQHPNKIAEPVDSEDNIYSLAERIMILERDYIRSRRRFLYALLFVFSFVIVLMITNAALWSHHQDVEEKVSGIVREEVRKEMEDEIRRQRETIDFFLKIREPKQERKDEQQD